MPAEARARTLVERSVPRTSMFHPEEGGNSDKRFLASGACRAPDPQRPAALIRLSQCHPFRKNAAAQTLKRGRLAEEVSFVGANAIEHEHQFLGIGFHSPVVSGKGAQFQGAQSLPQATDQHSAIFCAKMDSGFAEDEGLEKRELLRREIRDRFWQQ